MTKLRTAAGLGAALLLTATLAAAETVESGPKVGANIPGPFHPFNVTGEKAGKKNCLVCQNSGNPVAMVFAREITPTTTALLKKLDAATVANSKASMGSFVVFLNDEEGAQKKLETMAKDAGLKELIVAMDNPAGPEKYKVAKEADVTVVLYDADGAVKANYAFKKGELKDKDVETIVGDVSKILPKK
jgi:hypothetical protein